MQVLLMTMMKVCSDLIVVSLQIQLWVWFLVTENLQLHCAIKDQINTYSSRFTNSIVSL